LRRNTDGWISTWTHCSWTAKTCPSGPRDRRRKSPRWRNCCVGWLRPRVCLYYGVWISTALYWLTGTCRVAYLSNTETDRPQRLNTNTARWSGAVYRSETRPRSTGTRPRSWKPWWCTLCRTLGWCYTEINHRSRRYRYVWDIWYLIRRTPTTMVYVYICIPWEQHSTAGSNESGSPHEA